MPKRPPVTLDQLRGLSARAVIAYAARCAQRVRRLYTLPDGVTELAEHAAALDEALRLADGYVKGTITTDRTPPELMVAAAEAATAASAHNCPRATRAARRGWPT
jgi:hypothetical protein